MPDPRQGNVFQSKQRRRCGGPVIMYFKSAQTKLFWREMKITLQCMLKFGTLKSLAITQKCLHFQGAWNIKWLSAHKAYNSAWCSWVLYTSSKNRLRPLMVLNLMHKSCWRIFQYNRASDWLFSGFWRLCGQNSQKRNDGSAFTLKTFRLKLQSL